MGLFDFVKGIGNKLFSQEDEASGKIKQHIEESNPGIKDLDIQFNDGTVSLSGQADSAEAMEKAVLMAGNIQGVLFRPGRFVVLHYRLRIDKSGDFHFR